MKKPMFFRDYSYRKELLPVPYLRKLERGRQHEKIREATGFSIGQPGWGLIYYLVQASHRENGSGTIVETGSNLGATTVVLAQALLDARVRQPRVMSFEIDEKIFKWHKNRKSIDSRALVTQRVIRFSEVNHCS